MDTDSGARPDEDKRRGDELQGSAERSRTETARRALKGLRAEEAEAAPPAEKTPRAEKARLDEQPRTEEVRRVVEFDGTAWVVRSASGERASLRTPDRGTAVARAKEIVRHLGGGQVEVREKSTGAGTVATVLPPSRRRRR